MGLDIGPKAVELFKQTILKSKTILWNGPMGVFEMSNFQNGTKQIALTVAEVTSLDAYTLVGGGDSVAAVNKFQLANKVSYVSTGGGAMLEYFEGKILPGVAAIQNWLEQMIWIKKPFDQRAFLLMENQVNKILQMFDL